MVLGDFTQRQVSQENAINRAKHRCHVYAKLLATLEGCGMGPRLVLRFPLFRENVVAICKIGSLCSLDNLLQKNVIVFFFFKIKFQNGAHLKKGLFLTYFSHFLWNKKFLQQKYLTHINTRFLLTLLTFFFLPYQFWKKIRIYQVWFLFGMIPGVDSYSRHFGTINK